MLIGYLLENLFIVYLPRTDSMNCSKFCWDAKAYLPVTEIFGKNNLVWTVYFLYNMGQSMPLFIYFRHFIITVQIWIEKMKWMCCAWDSNQWPQDGRHRQNPQSNGGHHWNVSIILVWILHAYIISINLENCIQSMNFLLSRHLVGTKVLWNH